MGVSDVTSLIAEGTLDPELLEALLEADRLDHIAKRALIDASGRTTSDGDAGVDSDAVAEEPHVSLAQQHLQNGVSAEVLAAARDDMATASTATAAAGLRDSHGEPEEDDTVGGVVNSSSRFSKNGTHESARVIDVNENKGCASMHVPGMGVRPCFFSSLYDGDASQQKVFDNSACDAVSAALTGFNACVLHYGQTVSISISLFMTSLNVHDIHYPLP